MAVVALLALGAPLSAQSAQPAQAGLKATPAALDLFERDWVSMLTPAWLASYRVLMNWALKFYDSNRDILLQPAEAATAAEAFRKLADTDNDGRVTPEEYRAARAFILARY